MSLENKIQMDYIQKSIEILHCGRPWPAAYINFNQNIHQIQILAKPLCRAQAIFIRCRTTSGVPNIVG